MKELIEIWTESDSPAENESAKILVGFYCKIDLPNQVLIEWMVQKPVMYLKCNEVLLEFITTNFSKPIEQAGED